MFIGELAKLSGASPKAIRHYEALGLLGKVARSGVYRVYSESELAQVRLIKQAQALGFRLSELLAALTGAGSDWSRLSLQIQQKRLSIQAEIRRLTQLDQQLAQINQEILSCPAYESSVLDSCALPYPMPVAGV
ncbi:MerR family transcriptional regulator [Undibacterium piscinae]|uniref:MerR family transcriptional regulator n=1 Tax=Undibacterium piscinae TaxID=2495591 RepID=A0A6M4A680_9BURK|nr:MerR family transcriptional regulator [Undibacterium piscinae]